MAGKYIIFNCSCKEIPVLFSDEIEHKEMTLKTEWDENCTPVSAAYFTMNQGKIETYGSSKSLCLTSRPQDANLIQKLLTNF